MSREVTHRGRVYTVSDAHPVADEYRWPTEDEMDALAESIKRNRQKLPIRTLPDGRILDGRSRELACAIAGVEPTYQVANIAEFEVREFVEDLNDRRRHESVEERRERVAKLRAQGMSTRAIADAVGIDQKTVRNDLKAGEDNSSPQPEPEEVGTLPPPEPTPEVVTRPPETPKPPEVVKGRDGKIYPSTKPKSSTLPPIGMESLRSLRSDFTSAKNRVLKILSEPQFRDQFIAAARNGGHPIKLHEEPTTGLEQRLGSMPLDVSYSWPALDSLLAIVEETLNAAMTPATTKGVAKEMTTDQAAAV